jgi:hypothetical protein
MIQHQYLTGSSGVFLTPFLGTIIDVSVHMSKD